MQIWENQGSSYVNMNSKEGSTLSDLMSVISNNNSLFNTPHVNTDYICATVEINHLINGFNKLIEQINKNYSEDNKPLELLNQVLDYNNVDIENSENYTYLKLKKENKIFRTKGMLNMIPMEIINKNESLKTLFISGDLLQAVK
jgi:hypothetical protein